MDVNLDTDNKDIYNGYLYQTKNNNSDNEYIFFKEVQQMKRECTDISMFSRFLQTYIKNMKILIMVLLFYILHLYHIINIH